MKICNAFILLFILTLSFGCRQKADETKVAEETNLLIDSRYEISDSLKSIDGALTFFVIGDWGRNGEERQRDVAFMMSEAAKIIEPEFIISTGDNIYPIGVASVQDPLWMSSFESVYKQHNLFCVWNVVLGNHDYGGNVQAEIDYTKISRRWNMPSRYYGITKTLDDGAKVQFTYIDTSPFQDEYYSEDNYHENVPSQDTTKQKKWITNQLEQTQYDWKIVIGHHPMYTGGKRKDDINTTRKHLESIFTQNKVDVYFAGHEHDLQHIKPRTPTHHFVSGSGSEVRPTGMLPISKFAQSIQGFMVVSLTRKEMFVQVVDYTGKVIYVTAIVK